MARKLKYPVLWPFSTATYDLSSSLALYRYTEYGMLLREKLEIEGPYDVPDTYFTACRGNDNRSGIVLTDRFSNFNKHKKNILSYAKNQFVLNSFSIFEFFIANLIIFIWRYCAEKTASNKNLIFIWEEEKQHDFLIHSDIKNIEDDEWMKSNHLSNIKKKRIRILEDFCGFNIRDFSTNVDGKKYDWSIFKSHERLRHNIAHTAGRNSLYIENGLDKKEIEKDDIFSMFWFLTDLINNMNNEIYTVGILSYKH